jgi:hypothetical protein
MPAVGEAAENGLAIIAAGGDGIPSARFLDA